jgi:hypothetical protein
MIVGQPVADIGWEQEGLVAVAGTEVVGHGRSYATGLLCCLVPSDPLSSRFGPKLVRVNEQAFGGWPPRSGEAGHATPPAQHRAEQQSKSQPPRAVQGADQVAEQPQEHPADNQPQHCDRDPEPQRRLQCRPGATHSSRSISDRNAAVLCPLACPWQRCQPRSIAI